MEVIVIKETEYIKMVYSFFYYFLERSVYYVDVNCGFRNRG